MQGLPGELMDAKAETIGYLPNAMRNTILICLAMAPGIVGCSKKEESAPPPAPKSQGVSIDSQAPATPEAPPPPPVAAQPEATDSANADSIPKSAKVSPELMKLKKLCEKYFDDFGRFPSRWEDLINAKYIPRVPTGPDGKPLDYVEFTQLTANP